MNIAAGKPAAAFSDSPRRKLLPFLLARLTREGLETMQNYDWPGNVRELRNVIERAAIFAQGGALEFDLPVSGRDPTRFEPVNNDEVLGVEQEFLTDAEMRRRERENLFAVLRKTGWKIKGVDGAAEAAWREADHANFSD